MTRRRSPLPPDWRGATGRRATVLRRDGHRCQLKLPGCEQTATDVHHTGAHDDHRLHMLVAACGRCHDTVTGRDAVEARRKLERRAPTAHPGLAP